MVLAGVARLTGLFGLLKKDIASLEGTKSNLRQERGGG